MLSQGTYGYIRQLETEVAALKQSRHISETTANRIIDGLRAERALLLDVLKAARVQVERYPTKAVVSMFDAVDACSHIEIGEKG